MRFAHFLCTIKQVNKTIPINLLFVFELVNEIFYKITNDRHLSIQVESLHSVVPSKNKRLIRTKHLHLFQ